MQAITQTPEKSGDFFLPEKYFRNVLTRIYQNDILKSWNGNEIKKQENVKMKMNMFYRLNENGDAQIFFDSGEVVTRIAGLGKAIFPVGSQLSTEYEHPQGIVLTIADAAIVGISKE
jgi:hypothetical protein